MVLVKQRATSTVMMLGEIELTAMELQDVELGLITAVEWVQLSTKGKPVSRACGSLLSKWGLVLGKYRGGE